MEDVNVAYTVIHVPKLNDSFSRIVIDGVLYHIRFTYNNRPDCWKFGLYDSQFVPLFQDVKIVPGIPLNHAFCQKPYPEVWFGAKTKKERIGWQDFWNGDAEFFYMELNNGSES